MPFWDRFWRLRLVVAAMAAVFGALALVRLVLPALAPTHFSPDTLVALALGIGSLIAAVPLWTSAGPARDRMLRRERALAGDPDAMPRAQLPCTESGAHVSRVRRPLPRPPRRYPWTPTGRLAVYWRAGWFDRIFAGFFSIIAAGCLIVSVVVLIPFIRFLVVGEPRSVLRVTLGAIACLIVVFPVSLYLLYWAVPALLGQRPGVEVTREGICTRQLWGGEQAVTWEEARLLEVSAPRRFGLMAPHRTFRLYGTRSVAVWRDELRPFADYRLEFFEPDRLYHVQLRERMDALFDLVVKRTGLAPRTFAPQLARAETDARTSSASNGSTGEERPAHPRGWESES